MTTRNILCFGDSLTWGWIPVDPPVPSARYSRPVRWTGVLDEVLGDGYSVIEEGLSGRTTTAEDPADPRLNGSKHLPSLLASHLPLDLVVLMLGTNDTKSYFARTRFDIAVGISILVGQVLTAAGGVGTTYPAPRVLVVVPPRIADIVDPWLGMTFAGGQEKTAQLAEAYSAVCTFLGVSLFDAGTVIASVGVDGVHFTEQNNRDLGLALADKVRHLLQ